MGGTGKSPEKYTGYDIIGRTQIFGIGVYERAGHQRVTWLKNVTADDKSLSENSQCD